MRCAKCGSDNREGRKFCSKCGVALTRQCLQCGASNEPGESFCGECGTALTGDTPAVRTKTPHPTASGFILATSEKPDPSIALEGERKTVTAVFADIKGSTELMEDLDPEEARAIIDPALKLMMDAVRLFDGYIVQSTGDGIFAMFGAPLAHEDHPQRALYASLRMQEDLRHYGETLRGRGLAPVEIRVGVNTGEIVVRVLQTARGHAEYTPIGHSANLASRMQSIAATGTITVTEDTRRLCEGYFTFRSLGPTRVKGVSEVVNVHEVIGLGPLRTRLQASARRGLSKFVGREIELAQIKRALEMAKAGRGQIVAVVGEAGVGKSRLFYEFRTITRQEGLVLEGLSVAHGKASAHLPLIDLLKSYFEIAADEDAAKRRRKIADKVRALDSALEDALQYIFSLLEVAESDDPLARMDPEVRKRRTLDAVKRLLLRESVKRPLILIFEDLHWIDEGSLALLDLLAESIGTARVMIIVNYRSEFTHNWGNKTYYTQLRLDPLGSQSGQEMLDALLGESQDLLPLKHAIIEKTEGNPFFMEEIVNELFEQRALIRNGAIQLAKSLGSIKIPSTVQAVLASRIDRQSPAAKDLLQTLAVIGKEFPLRLIAEVSDKSDDELETLLSQLQMAEFIYEQPGASEIAYIFKHSLSQQVAYGSILVERRKTLHERTASVLEAQLRETVETQPELIARHYTEAGLVERAIPYWQRAGERALERWVNLEAINHLRKGLELIESLPEGSTQNRPDADRRYSLLLALGEAQFQAGEFLESSQTLVRAAAVAQLMASTDRIIRVALKLVRIAQDVGLFVAETVPLLEGALDKLAMEDSPLRVRALGGLARFLGVSGEREQLMLYAPEAVAMARRLGDPELIAYSLLGMFYALMDPEHTEERLAIATELMDLAAAANDTTETAVGQFWRGYCLVELGDVGAADSEFAAWGRWSEETNQPFYTSVATVLRAMRALMSGRFEDCELLAQQAFAIGRRLQLEASPGVFGLQMFALRREQGRLKEIEPVVSVFLQQHSAAAAWRPGLAVIYSELGRTDDARAEFEKLARLDFADLPHDGVWMGAMSYLVDVCTFLKDRARAEVLYTILSPFAGRNVVVSNGVACYGALTRYLGALATVLKRWDEAASNFEDALAMNARMNAVPWLAHTQHQYAVMLLERDASGDRDRAIALLDAALLTARELGMRALEGRITSVLSGTTSKLH